MNINDKNADSYRITKCVLLAKLYKLSLAIISLCLLNTACRQVEPDPIDFLSDSFYPQLIKRGGIATYSLENGVLTGSAIMDTPNTFLCTPDTYKNFILEFEVNIDPRLNSGVQIRSEIIQDKKHEAIKGYQVEIDPSERAWSGGIYEERDRGWIANLSANPAGKKAFKNDNWNKYHIEAIDSSIRVWINDINTANLLDTRYKEGLIGLQVHSIEDSTLAGTMVQWRNITLHTTNLEQLLIPLTPAIPEINLLADQLSQKEKAQGWNLLAMKNPCIEGKTQHDFVEKTGDFELSLEYTINKGGRAGLVYGQDSKGKDLITFSLFDDAHGPEGIEDNTKAGALLHRLEPINLSTKGRDKGLRSHDHWSQLRLKCYQGKVEHWLNNDLVVAYDLDDIEGLHSLKRIFLRTEGDSLCVRSFKYLDY